MEKALLKILHEVPGGGDILRGFGREREITTFTEVAMGTKRWKTRQRREKYGVTKEKKSGGKSWGVASAGGIAHSQSSFKRRGGKKPPRSLEKTSRWPRSAKGKNRPGGDGEGLHVAKPRLRRSLGRGFYSELILLTVISQCQL